MKDTNFTCGYRYVEVGTKMGLGEGGVMLFISEAYVSTVEYGR